MYFTEEHKRAKNELDCIMRLNMKYGMVQFTHEQYKDVRHARKILSYVAGECNYPITFLIYNNELYFTRRDV